VDTEGSAWFIICLILKKIIPGQPMMFWVRYGHNEAQGSKNKQLSRPDFENGAHKVS